MTEETVQTTESTAPAMSATQSAGQPEGASTVKTQANLHQVMVDQWGHRGEFIRGQIVNLGDLDSNHYDIEHAVRMGVLRPLTQAESRPGSLPLTTPLNDQGELDVDHQRAMQFAAGMTPEAPRTVTTAPGPAEPAEFAKPTIPFTGDNQPAGRPVVVVDTALEAETEATRATRIVPSPAGSVFESAADRAARESGGQRPSAADLAAQARAASTNEQLDAIDAQADNRMTSVHDAVAARRAELAQQG